MFVLVLTIMSPNESLLQPATTTLPPALSALALLWPVLLAAPWWIAPAVLWWRLRSTPSLDDLDASVLPVSDAPRVSVILPARNEAVHIAACVRSILRSTWANLELIVVDDHSTDGTSALAREAGAGDPRLTILSAPDLPDGWFGKQWACQSGAAQATGSLLLFTDADTRHSPELIARMVRARTMRGAELMSVAGRQEMRTIWEQAVQPCVFTLILLRFGGAQAIEGARSASDVVANGQCFMLSRTAYDALGGHHAVRAFVAEDVMMAQAVWATGARVSMVLGIRQLSTHMYDGLAPLIKGWGKNVYAGGRLVMRGGAFGRAIYPLVLLSFPLLLLLPFVAFAWAVLLLASGTDAAASRATSLWLVWSALASGAVVITFAVANRLNHESSWRALLAPLGSAVLFVICAFAIVRGRSVSWKGRGYVTR